MLATFEHRGYVEQGKVNGKYRAGLSAYETGRKFLYRMDLPRKSKPIMENLVHDCNEVVYLVVPGKKNVLLLDLAEPKQQVQVMSLIGNRYNFDKSSAGLVVEAFKGKSEQLNGQQKEILQLGCCIDQNALAEGVVSVSVPIFTSQGQITGCLCMVAPEFRVSKEKLEQLLLLQIKGAGQAVSATLGYFDQYLSIMSDSYASLQEGIGC